MRLVLLALLAAAPPLAAQTTLSVGAPVEARLAAGGADVYVLDLDANAFVAGRADQRSVDVVVTVSGPDGAEIATFDGPARGAEPFQFEGGAAGRYTIAVAPFEGEAGDYAIALARVEPVATTPAGRVDQRLARFEGDDRPGVLVAVVDGGEVVFQRAYGMANLTHGVPMTLDTRTNIGSTSKQFTAFALALLADRGALSLDDDVRAYLPELPDFGETVTLRHLLTHTSGYREFLNLLYAAGRRIDEGDYIDPAEVVRVVQRQPALQDAPGTVWNYNNTGYALAALVVERVTGQPFPEWMAENVFAPAGMTDTVVRASPSEIVPGSAQGYVADEDGGWREARDLGAAVGPGAVYTTVADLAQWMRNYDTAALGGRAVVDQMTTRYVLADGDTTDYGLGLIVDTVGGRRRVHHGGADSAHRSAFAVYPEIGAGVLVLTNAPENVGGFADRVAQTFFADRFLDPAETAEAPDAGGADPGGAVDFDDALFDDYAGRYALDVAPDFVLAFRRGDDGGYLTQATGQPAFEIVPTSDSTFVLTAIEAGLTFHRDADGVVRSATLHQNGDNRATKLDAEPTDAAPPDLGAFAGRYASDELEAAYTLSVVDGELVAALPRYPEPFPLRHTAGDTFTLPFGPARATIEFARDAAGAVTGFALDAGGRSRGIRFERAD